MGKEFSSITQLLDRKFYFIPLLKQIYVSMLMFIKSGRYEIVTKL
jgi:hypothetical protein